MKNPRITILKPALLALVLTITIGIAGFSYLNAQAEGGRPQADKSHTGIIPINARYGGFTYGEWMAKMNQWALSIPAADNPTIPGNEAKIATAQPEHVWFLMEWILSPTTEVHYTVPAGRALFVPLFVQEVDDFLCIDPPGTSTVDQLREAAKGVVDGITELRDEIDGVPVRDVTEYRTTSPVFFSTLPDHNLVQDLFGCANGAGTYGPMVADGYALLLAPLSVGEHTLHESFLFSDPIDITFHITATP